jgi:hypothetical protein
MSDRAREVLVVCCAVSAGVHAALTPEHFDERAAAGVGFALSAVLLAGIALLLARRLTPLLVDAAILLLLGLIGAYILGVTTGVPGLVPEPEAVEGIAVATKVIEAVGVIAAAALRWSPSRPRSTVALLPVAVVVALSALMTAPVAGGHHHGGDHHDHHSEHHDG